MADVVYNHFKAKIMDGTIDLDTDDVRVALLTSNYTPDKDAHHYWDEVNANEVSGTGYTAGGQLLSGKAVTIDDTDDEGVFDADDVTWTNSSITARYAVVFKSTSQASTSDLVCAFDFGSDKTSSSGDFTISWNDEGVLNLN